MIKKIYKLRVKEAESLRLLGMNDKARDKLKYVINKFGSSICEDSGRCEALLKDLCPDCKREVTVLCLAFKDGIPQELISSSSSVTPKELLLPRLAKKLYDNLVMEKEVANWVVETWARVTLRF
ncbi:MAG: hypothetical protein HQK79_20770 [Desulfobacterales bacterium]|nr:hypothetical protein [Desulfobacterales bacterium]